MGQKVEVYNASNSRKPTVSVGIAAQGSDNELYLLTVNQATGALKVDASVTANPDININQVGGVNTEKGLGTPGPGSLRVGAMLGLGSTAVSTANPVPGSVIVAGAAIDPRAVRALSNATDAVTAFQGSTWTVALSNQISGFALNTDLLAMSAKLPATLGQKTAANSMSVVLASDGVLVAGRTCHQRIYMDYAVTNVTTGAYVQITAATSAATALIEIFDSSGQALHLATGAAASEANQIQIFPGGNGPISLAIGTATRLSLRAITGTANTGIILINCYS